MKHICPVCGYDDLSEPAYDEYGTPSYQFCLSCNFQFGFHDDSEGYTFEQWREGWIANGMLWGKGKFEPAPANWNPRKQLLNLI